MEFRSLIVKSQAIVSEAVSIAVNAKEVVSSYVPESCRGCAIASRKSAMDA